MAIKFAKTSKIFDMIDNAKNRGGHLRALSNCDCLF